LVVEDVSEFSKVKSYFLLEIDGNGGSSVDTVEEGDRVWLRVETWRDVNNSTSVAIPY